MGKILTMNVLNCIQDHMKSLKTTKVEAIKELVTVENKCWMIPININNKTIILDFKHFKRFLFSQIVRLLTINPKIE